MSVYIPCLNPDTPDDGSGWSVGAGTGTTFGETLGTEAGISITNRDSPISLVIGPIPPFLGIGINFQFWANVFGLGETRIHREKEQIQDVLTPIFQYLNGAYGVPITDGHALQFPSDGVQAQFARRPDIAALAPSFMTSSYIVTSLVFADTNTSLGEQERVVNQFLANAAYNNWPVDATVQIWDGMVQATDPSCSQDKSRWMQNPYILKRAAELSTLLKYVPLSALVNLATNYEIGEPLAQNLILMWANHPELVASIPHEEKFDWQYIYESGNELQDPYTDPLNPYMPLYQRQHIIDLFNTVQVQLPTYPNFLWPTTSTTSTQTGNGSGTTTTGGTQAGTTTGGTQTGTTTGTQGGTTTGTQGGTTTGTQTTTAGTQTNTLEIPNQQDYDRACEIVRTLSHDGTLSTTDSEWLLTAVGARAYYKQSQNPLCYLSQTGTQGTTTIPTQQGNCPTEPTQTTTTPTQTTTTPTQTTTTPTDTTQPDLTPCPPSCQEQIDVLEQKVHECCNETSLYVVPQLQDLWRWVTDLEHRVPGPSPQLPNTPTDIPTPGELPPVDVDYPQPDVPPPPTTGYPPIDPTVVDCVSTLCDVVTPAPTDPASLFTWVLLTFCSCVKRIADKAKKLVIDACQFGQQAWGIMAECWLNANTPQPTIPLQVPPRYQSLSEISDAIDRTLMGGGDVPWDDALRYAGDLIDGALMGNPQVAQWPYNPSPALPPFIFADTTKDTHVEIPIVEGTP